MRLASEITVARIGSAVDDDDAPRCEIVVEGARTGKRIPGAVLEAALQCGERYLLFLTDDVPFEEALRIATLDRNFDVQDWATIGGPYTSGSFSDLRIEPPDSATFRFIGGTTWRVRLLGRRGFRIPFFSEPRGVWRKPGFFREFIVEGKPEPEVKRGKS